MALVAAAVVLVARAPARAAAPVRIMPEGDSITAGYTDNPNWNMPFQFGYYIRNTLVPGYAAQGKHVSTVNQYNNLLTGGTIDASLFANGYNHPGATAYDRMVSPGASNPATERRFKTSQFGSCLVM